MIAVDTNFLVHAHREDSNWHGAAFELLASLAEGPGSWAIPWPCVHEFLAVVTHPRIFDPPTALATAAEQVEAWIESPSLVLLAEAAGYWSHLAETLRVSQAAGAKVHDARVAALCAYHGVKELWTADRDFGRFPGVKVRNPLVAG